MNVCPIITSYSPSILTITLNRPCVLNAINLEMAEILKQTLLETARDTAIRAIVLTGSGRAFCSGGDLKFAHQVNPEVPGDSFWALTSVLHVCIEEMREMSKPVIAAINGPAAGAGLFLALACDLRVMAQSAYLKQSNTSHGLSIPAGGTFTLPRLIGMGRALEIALLDEPIPSAASLNMGLVSQVVSDDALLSTAQQLAARVAQMPIETLGRVKRLMNDSFDSTLSEQMAAEQHAISQAANSSEGREGVLAFLQKRSPQYS